MTARKSDPAGETVVYIRVSHHEQVESGLSLEFQHEKAAAYGVVRDLEVDRFIVDDPASAGNLKRPGLSGLLDDVKEGRVKRIIIYKLDRLTRAMRDLSMLLDLFERHKVELASVLENLDTSTASGKLVVHMLGVVAEWERNSISERVRDAMAVKRARGEKLGGRNPYGFEADENGMLVPVPAEQETIETIMRLRDSGQRYTQIAQYLIDHEVPTKIKGAKWHVSTVRAIVKRVSQARESASQAG